MVFKQYAKFYDMFYKRKDYAVECDFLETVFKRYAKKPISSILDVGCGTGTHACMLAKRGYKVTGVDFSEPMLACARMKACNDGLEIDFQQSDVKTLNILKKFDACVSMFAVMGYQITNDDFENTLKSIRTHLDIGGVFVFDVWFGPAVLTTKPSERTMEITEGEEKILKIAVPVMDIIKHVVQVNYTVIHIIGDKVIENVSESHFMRFFFPQELNYFLKKTGFHIDNITPFMAIEKELTVNDWNISVIARAV